MLTLLQKIKNISSCKDRLEITKNFMLGVFEYSEAIDISLYQTSKSTLIEIAKINNNGVSVFLPEDSANHKHIVSEQFRTLALQGEAIMSFIDTNSSLPSYILCNSKASKFSEQLTLLLNLNSVISIEDQKALNYFFCYFINYLSLLDYSESDSLTGLLNRKTFDDTFYDILNSRIDPISEDRRNDIENDYWLAELDIDKFKNINDKFGHLFGDEVLIRVSNIMHQYLRSYDKLFRFGGEEFIIIFKTINRETALFVLNRLINLIENSDFPQIGKVTCSIGFTKIDSMIPVDILGKADQALYYAKNNGRNQVQCYEDLIEQGLLKKSPISSTVQDDVDIFFT